jgi:hypothetical protein
MKKIILLLALTIGLFSCTENTRVKSFGGTGRLELPKGHKLINITWKETELWYLTKPMSATDSAETYYFQEESNFGLVKGTFVIVETK